MTYPINNTFSSFSMTEKEQRDGAILNSLNLAVLHNLRSQTAEQKLNLVFTPNDVLSYTQQESYLKGQLDILSYLISASEEVVQSQSQSQQHQS